MPSHPALTLLAWLIALTWLSRTIAATRGLPRVPNLLHPQHDLTPHGNPTLTVIVPARDEAPNILPCLHSLLAQDYPIHIIAVDDRSTDATGAHMDTLAAQHPGRLAVLHITDLPPGWLGKTHALALAARHAAALHPQDATQPTFLLFTDADIVFRPDALRRALAEAQRTQADHFVLLPTTLIHRWDEAVVLGFFQTFALWGGRPWRVEDPKALRDAVGIGAFNLIRHSAYLHLGGFESQRMDILEDLILARRVKQAGLRQRIAFGRGLVTVHWAAGASGLIGVMTKNLFAVFRFHATLLLAACAWLALFAVAPAPALFFPATRLPALLILACIAWSYRLYGRHTGIATWNFLFYPVGAALFILTLLRSMTVTFYQRGVIWRGTFYSLKDLRANAAPLIPRKNLSSP